MFAIVADVVPYARRARATAIVAASFSLAAVAGVPLALWLAAHYSWRAPFLVLAALSVVVALVAMRMLPPLRAHLAHVQSRHPVEQLRRIFGVPNHLRAFALMITLMFAGFTVIPFIAPYKVANVGIAECDLAIDLFRRRRDDAGHRADHRPARRSPRQEAHVHASSRLVSIVPILITTHLPPLPLAAVVPFSVLFFVFVTGRFGPAMALVSRQRRAAAARQLHELQRARSSSWARGSRRWSPDSSSAARRTAR